MNEIYNNLWVEKYRPTQLEDLILDDNIKKDIIKYGESGEIPHLLLYGNAGSGKTTLARIIVNSILECQYLYINASDESGVDTVRGKIRSFSETKSIDGKLKVIILDECDGFSSTGGGGSSAQQALRNVMEEYSKNCRFILTANYIHKLIDPLISRCVSYKIDPPFKGFIKRCFFVLNKENIKIGDKKEIISYLQNAYPDMRLAINCIQRDSLTGTLLCNKICKIPTIVYDIVSAIIDKKPANKIREMIIKRSSEFKSDYRNLLKDIFNVVYESDIPTNKKGKFMIEIAAGLYKHEIVMDKEINCFATILKIME